MPRRIILDCDPGVDDAIAILLALASPDEIELEAITTVGGNVPLSLTTKNAIRVCDIARRNDIPVYAGAFAPIARTGTDTENVHGSDGLGDIGLPEASRFAESESAAQAIARMVSTNPGEITICVTGPMTNLAVALLMQPGLAALIPEVVFMGGAVNHPGNTTPLSEFNIWFDAHAADIVFRSGIPLVMFGLDVTSTAVLTTDRINNFALRGRAAAAAAKMLAVYADGDPCLHDPCVIAYLIKPELFKGEQGHIRSLCATGAGYGRTALVDHLPPNCIIMQTADVEQLFNLLSERIERLN